MRVAVGLALLLTAGCNQEPEVSARNASVQEVAEKVRSATKDELFVRPGQWRSTVVVEDVSLPGVPPEVAEQTKRMMAESQSRTQESCLTEEQARRPNENLFASSEQCRYEHFDMGGGKIDAKMRCAQGQASQLMEMQGTYSPDRYEMRVSTRMEGGKGSAAMTMRLRVTSERTGECAATKA